MNDPLLTTADLAARWSVRPGTLRIWRSKDIGPAYVRIGTLIRYRMSDVIEFENRGAIARATGAA